MRPTGTLQRATLLGMAALAAAVFGASPARSQAAGGFKPAMRLRSAGRRSKPADLRDRVEVVKPGGSSKSARKSAEALLAAAKLTQKQRRKVNSVLKDTSFFRELPTLRFEVDPRTYLYFIEEPDVTVSMWQAMNITKFKLTRRSADDFAADGGDGTRGYVQVLQRSPAHQIIYCRGTFKTPLMLTGIKTASVIHLQTQFTRSRDGRTFATHRAFVHVAFPSSTVEAVAKVLSPVANLILDRNFREISLFVHVMSLAMAKRPGWIEHIAVRMQNVSDEQKKGLLKVTARVWCAARKRETIPLFKSREEYLKEIVRPLQVEKTASGGGDNAQR